jgi:stage IV sporulation protein FB
VLLLEPNETPYDLRFRLLGTEVRVHPMFWLISFILGFDGLIQLGAGYVLLWVACVFVSVLLHEFGHVLMGRVFGSRGHIVLYSFGGLAIGSNQLRKRWQRILVLFAGPLIQLVLYLIIWKSSRWYLPHVPVASLRPVVLGTMMLLQINWYWPLLNLLPIWPLDGGQIMRELCVWLFGERGVSFSLGISMVVAGLFAAHMLLTAQDPERGFLPYVPAGDMFMALFFALFTVSSFLALQAENQRRRQWHDDDWHWQR